MPALALAAVLAAAPAAVRGASPALRFGDDYAAALAQARARGVPLVVDVWAPW
jgi:hypothetical protein